MLGYFLTQTKYGIVAHIFTIHSNAFMSLKFDVKLERFDFDSASQ